MILTTGGAGFIGSNFVLDWLAVSEEPVFNLGKLSYAGNLENFDQPARRPASRVRAGRRRRVALLARLLAEHGPRAVVNFAAERHVVRSIHGPEDFIQTNIVGNFRLLESVPLQAQSSADQQIHDASGARLCAHARRPV